jgi:hypothetical protein
MANIFDDLTRAHRILDSIRGTSMDSILENARTAQELARGPLSSFQDTARQADEFARRSFSDVHDLLAASRTNIDKMFEHRRRVVEEMSRTGTLAQNLQRTLPTAPPLPEVFSDLEVVAARLRDTIGVLTHPTVLPSIQPQIDAALRINHALEDSIRRFARDARAPLDYLSREQDRIRELLRAVGELGAVLPMGPVTVNHDGTISVAGETLTEAETLETAQALSESLEGATSLPDLLERLVTFFRNLNPPAPKSLLGNIALWFFLEFLAGPAIRSLIEPPLPNPSPEDVRILREECSNSLSNELGPETLAHLRIVTASTLNVRREGSLSADIHGTLRFGQLVQVIEEQDNWALVEHKDVTGTISLQGWVDSRYIEPLQN